MISQHIFSQESIKYVSQGSFLNVVLNRPKALNSLNLQMVNNLTSNINKINNHKVVWFTGQGDKALCAGGDVKILFQNKATAKDRLDFFKNQFILDYKLSTLQAIQISCWNGIVMGGGVGLTVFAPIVIATQKTLFAMPEAKLGFFTDVGVNYKLARLRNNIGYYLGMTGSRLKGQQVYISGLANFYILSSDIQKVKLQIKQYINNNVFSLQNIKKIISKYHKQPTKKLINNEQQIKQIFSYKSPQQIILNLQNKNDQNSKNILKLLKQQCPTSVCLIHSLIKLAQKNNLRQTFIMDYRIIQHMATNDDFREGVRTVLIQKGAVAKWSRQNIKDVTQQDVNNFLKPIKNSQILPI